ncbi:MAG: Cof-type HAD-IIB family hydrolase [Firmicutes bacterium]|nr:Cof-type HAD-IIB family hydrolase [Bacillota bacterium]
MKYKIVCTDFDDTLLRDDNTISKYTMNTINRYVEKGGIFLINTGRMMASIIKRAKELGLRGKIVGYNGAMIYDLDTDKIIYKEPIDYKDAADLLKILEELNLVIHIYIEDTLYYKEKSEYTKDYEKVCNVKGVCLNKVLSEYILEKKVNPTKILAFAEPELVAKLIQKSAEQFENKFFCCSSKPYFFEALKFGINKGTALKVIADSLNIKMEEVMAFGDSLNDHPMLEVAGLSFAVKNALEETKKVAMFVCESNNEDGVAKTIQRYCLM